MKECLLNFSICELEKLIADFGEPKFRAKQLFVWLHNGGCFKEMSNIPKKLIERLECDYCDNAVEILDSITGKDGTVKYLYKLVDGNIIEGVLMKYKYGNTLCVSTQVGCRMNCAFCASGLDGLIRNLTSAEILGQIIQVNKANGGDIAHRAVTNVVLMGSGEPLDNYENVSKFLKLVNAPNGINISERNISLSTSGLADGIRALADDGFSVTMTVSLHSPNDELRETLMPVNKKWKIADVIDACKYYFDKTGRRYIFEYALIYGKNDTKVCATELANLLKGLPCHVNLIRLNYVKEKGLRPSDNAKAFLEILTSHNISATIRRTMGNDIDGACGQLRRRYLNEKND